MTELRSPIICVLGHVDSGKTSFMDKLRNTHIQNKEFGGITQQIGATYFNLNMLIRMISHETDNFALKSKIKINGLLFIDTPGHECFKSQRMVGLDICDMAILIIDINKGIEKCTIESIELMKAQKKPFIVVVNKLDKLYKWVTYTNQTITQQKPDVVDLYNKKMNDIICQFASQGLNTKLFYKNIDFKTWISLVPLSANTGEGINDLIKLLIELSQKYMEKKLTMEEENKTNAMILEIRKDKNASMSLDVILINGYLSRGDKIFLQTSTRIITAEIISIMVLEDGKEMKNKGKFKIVDTINASHAIRINIKSLDDIHSIISGSHMYKCETEENNEKNKILMKKEADNNLSQIQNIKLNKYGLTLVAPNFGMLLSLYHIVDEKNIPVSNVFISNEITKDIILKSSIQIDRNDDEYLEQYAMILHFDQNEINKKDVTNTQIQIKSINKKIDYLTNNIIYHLTDEYSSYTKNWYLKMQIKYKHNIITPYSCIILKEHIYNKSDPIICGVKITEGELSLNSLISTTSIDNKKIILGKIIGIKYNNQTVDKATLGQEVSIKIVPHQNVIQTYEKDFDHKNELYSYINKDVYDFTKKYAQLNDKQIILLDKINA